METVQIVRNIPLMAGDLMFGRVMIKKQQENWKITRMDETETSRALHCRSSGTASSQASSTRLYDHPAINFVAHLWSVLNVVFITFSGCIYSRRTAFGNAGSC